MGRRDHTKEDVNMLVYKDEIKVFSCHWGGEQWVTSSHLQGWVKLYRRVSRLSDQRPREKPTFRQAAKEAATKIGMSTLNMLLD